MIVLGKAVYYSGCDSRCERSWDSKNVKNGRVTIFIHTRFKMRWLVQTTCRRRAFSQQGTFSRRRRHDRLAHTALTGQMNAFSGCVKWRVFGTWIYPYIRNYFGTPKPEASVPSCTRYTLLHLHVCSRPLRYTEVLVFPTFAHKSVVTSSFVVTYVNTV